MAWPRGKDPPPSYKRRGTPPLFPIQFSLSLSLSLSSLNVFPFEAAPRVENSLLKHTAVLLVFGPSLYFRNLCTGPETGVIDYAVRV